MFRGRRKITMQFTRFSNAGVIYYGDITEEVRAKKRDLSETMPRLTPLLRFPEHPRASSDDEHFLEKKNIPTACKNLLAFPTLPNAT